MPADSKALDIFLSDGLATTVTDALSITSSVLIVKAEALVG